ncbi:MAG: PEP-CTERM sorting domain-containing protein [Planctomycetales bacterium]|nr:PEP-CTERM sorting domain-containing protein [Planctomycetales bacterium]
MKRLRKSVAMVVAVVTLSAAISQPASAGLTFTTTYDSSVDANARGKIDAVLAGYSALFSDNVNVSLKFTNSGTGLGTSLTYSFAKSYQDFRTALASDASSANDGIALSHLPSGINNPVNSTASISQGRPGWAAIGINVDVSGIANYFDGEIDLNLAEMNYDRIAIDPNKYDLQAVTQHEVNEVLGVISNVGNTDPRPIDLFRYDSNGNRTFTTAGDDAYFSIDGTTKLARFNQEAGGDYGDFWSAHGGNVPQVQDAFSSPGATPNMNAELVMLDVVGWNRISNVPEPSSLAIVGLIAGALATCRRRR